MSEIKISTQEDNDFIQSQIRKFNRKYWSKMKDYSFNIKQEGEIIAGIVAQSTFNTLEIEFLYVDEKYRRQGLGSKLLKYVEDSAKKDNLKHIFLNTYSFQAPKFYKKENYNLLFKIDNCIGEYGQYFYWKDI